MNVSCGAHLGDILWIANMLSKIPEHHVFSIPKEYHPQMNGLLAGLDIELTSIEEMSPECKANDCWIANGRFEQSHNLYYKNDIDIIGFVMKYMNAQCEVSGHAPVFNDRQDFLLDFPSIRTKTTESGFDILLINANPKSGQCPQYSEGEIDVLKRVIERNRSIVYINDESKSLLEIALLSCRARVIIGCATGPMWVTLIKRNVDKFFMVLLDPQRLDLGLDNMIHMQDSDRVEVMLGRYNWL